MKVIWICHFSNSEIQEMIPLWKNRDEFASWMPNLIKGFENRKDIDLHIIAPHEYLKKTTTFTNHNISYYFIPFGIPLYFRHWPSFFRFDILTGFLHFRHSVRKITNRIQPDIINLFGTENAYYSSSVLDIKDKYKTLITIQGFISQFKDSTPLSWEQRKRIEIEEKLLGSNNFFCGEMDSSDYIKSYNDKHVFFKFYFPVNEKLVSIESEVEKIYDCIYFGKLSQSKGTEDFIKVIAELKKEKENIKACIVGSGNSEPFINQARSLDCDENIEFIGFVKTQKKLFEYVKSSRVFLAPPYKERLSSTIRETMLLKVPIVAYATGGIPYINEFDEYIYLVKTGDYKAMAQRTLLLLNNTPLSKSLAKKAYSYASKEYGLAYNVDRLISAYYSITNSKHQ